MSGNLFALGNQFLAGFGDGYTADRQRARTISAHTKLSTCRVTVDYVNILDRHTKQLCYQLGKRGLMSLTMGMRTGEYLHIAGGIEADLGTFPQTNSSPQLTHRSRGRNSASLNVGRKPDAPSFTSRPGLLGASRETGVISQLYGLVQGGLVVAAVITLHHRCLIGEGVLRYKVSAPDFDWIHAHFGGGHIHQPFQQVSCLRSASTPAGIYRRSIGEHSFDL